MTAISFADFDGNADCDVKTSPISTLRLTNYNATNVSKNYAQSCREFNECNRLRQPMDKPEL
ncbi:MAG: hypothetical protein QOI13_3320 [Paraburkholderia sp.]|nr:hypothetical protein [Paraburkholderia sp.]